MRKLLATTSMSLFLAGTAFAQSGVGAGVSGGVGAGVGADTGVAEAGVSAQADVSASTSATTNAGETAQDEVAEQASKAGEAVEETWDKTKDVASDAYDATKEAAGAVAENVAEAYDEVTIELKGLMTRSAQQGYVVISPEVVVAAEIEGQPVYDMENNRIGEVASVETGASGQVEAATIEIGGFLGIGEAEVEVDAKEMGVVRNDKSDVRVYVAATEDELEQRAEMSNS